MYVWFTEREKQFHESPTTINSCESIKNGEMPYRLSHWCVPARADLLITMYKYKLILKIAFENCL